MAVLGFSHPRLSFLTEVGIPVGKKSRTVKMPESLMTSRHAWRGVLDGDGYVSLIGPAHKQRQLHVGLRTGSIALRDQFAAAAAEFIGGTKGICVHARGVTVTNRAGVALIDALYRDARYTIRRKRLKAVRLAVEFGNAVTPPVAEVIISALVEAISGETLAAA
jgi:hypothetical protein